MATDENFSFAESALRAARNGEPVRPVAQAPGIKAPRPKRIKFTLGSSSELPAVAGGSGFDPYNSAGGLDRKPAWDRVTKR